MKEAIKMLAVILGVIVLVVYFGRQAPLPTREFEATTTQDTITIRDTIYVSAPAPVDSKRLGFAKVRLPYRRVLDASSNDAEADTVQLTEENDDAEAEPPDSIKVAIPVEQRHYAGEDYEAWVSGWNPRLDSLRIFQRQTTITNSTAVTKWKTRRWGISAGAGLILAPKGGVQPGIFIGASYIFLSF